MKPVHCLVALIMSVVAVACGDDPTAQAPPDAALARGDRARAAIVRADPAPQDIDERDAIVFPPDNPFSVSLSALSTPSADVVNATLTWTLGAFPPNYCFVTDSLRTVSEDIASGTQDVTLDATTTFSLYCDDCAGHRADAQVVVAGPTAP